MFLDIIAACCSLSVGFLFGFGSTGFAASFSGSSLNLIPALKLNKQKNGIDTASPIAMKLYNNYLLAPL
jgi:hypothetical protein